MAHGIYQQRNFLFWFGWLNTDPALNKQDMRDLTNYRVIVQIQVCFLNAGAMGSYLPGK